jgi:hypothetical protein
MLFGKGVEGVPEDQLAAISYKTKIIKETAYY